MSDVPEVGWNDEMRSMIVKVTENWIVSVTPMIFNDRLLLSNHNEWHVGWTAGWCYDKGGVAHLAAEAWDPETQHEPMGYKKVAADAR